MGRNLALLIFIPAVLLFSSPALGQSDEARRHFDRGMAAVEMAKAPEDLQIAINEFKEATILAPDWPDAFFNLGKVQEAAEKFAEAIASLRRYLELAPNAPDGDAVRSMINKIAYKAENVITAEKAVAILGQLSTWSAKESPGFHRYVRPLGPNSIEVPTSILWKQGRTEPDVFHSELKVNGPKISFRYTTVLMDRNNVGNTTTDYEIEIEVVSPTRVKVKAVGLWTYWALGGDTVTRTSEFELVPSSDSTGFDEQFEKKAGGWEFRNPDGSAEIANGKLFFEHRKVGTNFNISKMAAIATYRDFTIESLMKFITGDEGNFYGFLWGRKDANNFYYFGITANGNYAFRKLINGAWSEVISYRPSPFIKTHSNSNKLAVKKRGGLLEFYINDHMVGTVPFEDFSGGIGFHLNHTMKVEVDYLKVTYP